MSVTNKGVIKYCNCLYIPGLGNVDRHGGNSGDETADHTGTEMTHNVVREGIYGENGIQ